MSGQFSINIILAANILSIFDTINQGIDQYRTPLINQVGQLEGTWQSPNKQSFYNDWVSYCNALNTLYDVGPRLAQGLKNEINLVQQAEQVQF